MEMAARQWKTGHSTEIRYLCEHLLQKPMLFARQMDAEMKHNFNHVKNGIISTHIN